MAGRHSFGVLFFSLTVASVFSKDLFTLQDVEAIVERATKPLIYQIQALNEQNQLSKDLIEKLSFQINENTHDIQVNKEKINIISSHHTDKDEAVDAGISKRFVVDGEIDLQQSVITLQQKVHVLETSSGSGASYTRWGRTTCPGNGTERVYSGYVGGSWYDNRGGSNYVCLTSDPTWNSYDDGHQDGSDIYGAEFQRGSYSSSQYEKFFGKHATEDDDVPCAVCRSTRPSSIMIPGRNICYPGWTLEYSGYLMSDYPGHGGASEFVCMDSQPEVIPHGHVNDNGALFYLTEAVCGSLTCPPYVDGRELTCAVCSK